MKNEEKTSKKKTKIVLIIVGSLLILIGLFLFWFFNRKFEVTFKVSESEKYIIQVKYNRTIKEDDIKTEEELGERFIAWYEVESITDDKEVLAKDSFDFSTKIKKDVLLKAVFEAEAKKEETVTVTFDTKGGNKVKSITINKGDKLTFPTSPKKDGYTFVAWTLKNGKTVKNNTKFSEDTTLYASWKKNEEPKTEAPKVEEKVTIAFDTKGGNSINSITISKGAELTLPDNPKKDGHTFTGWTLANGSAVKNKTKFSEDTTLYANWKKNEETISLSLSRSVIHRNGNKTSKATAKVENASGDVTYSIDSNACVRIDKNTGELTAEDEPTGSATKIKAWRHTCAENGNSVTVTATLPSGKSASAKLTIEKDLILYASFYSIPKHYTVTADGQKSYADGTKFSVEANQNVTWSAKAVDDNGTCTPVNNSKKSTTYEGNTEAQCSDGSPRNTNITATTEANQKITVYYFTGVN